MGKVFEFFKYIGKEFDEYAYGIERKKKSGFEWRAAGGFNIINQMESFYIYKPWGRIFRTLNIQFFRFAALTFVSFDVLIWFFIPVWAIVVYEYALVLKWMGKYNISSWKILILTLFVEILFLILSPAARRLFWFFISGV